MAFRVIARIVFEAEVDIHPQSRIDFIDLPSPPWTLVGDTYVKDEDVVRYSLTKISDSIFELIIEQIDLFGLEKGPWTDEQYPVRRELLASALQEIGHTLNARRMSVKEIHREVE